MYICPNISKRIKLCKLLIVSSASISESWLEMLSSQIEGEVHIHEDEFDEAADVGAEAGLGQAVEAEVNERLPLPFYDELPHGGVLGAEVDQQLEAQVLCFSSLSVTLEKHIV